MKRVLIVLIAALVASGALAQVERTPAAERMADVIAEASQQGWLHVGPEEAIDYIFQVEPYVLDVRTADEFADGYIEGAVNIPVSELDANLDQLPSNLDTPIVVYCAVGIRGFWGMVYLTSLGYDNVQNVRGGYTAWVDAGLPTATP